MAVLVKAIYRFSVIAIKIPMVFFTDLEKTILRFTGKDRRTAPKAILTYIKRKCYRYCKPDLKFDRGATVAKPVWYWHKNRPIDEENRLETPESTSYNHDF